MKARALTLGIVVSVVLLGIAGGLHFLAGSLGEQGYRDAVSLTRQVHQLSSEWSVEVARVKADPLADFDSLAAFIPRMVRLKGELLEAARGIPGLPDRLASDISAYLSTVEAKEERIERFKTGYAVVRNSARYLPLAAANVTRQAREARDEGLASAIAVLVQDMDLYLASPTETARTRLDEELARLREASLSHPPALANGLANLLAHAEVLLDRQGPTEELFRGATSGDIAEFTARLTGSLEFELGRKELRSLWYERGVLAVLALLALFWVGLALLQRGRGAAVAAASVAVRGEAAAEHPAAAALAGAPPGDDATAPARSRFRADRDDDVDDPSAALLVAAEAEDRDGAASAEAGMSAEAAVQQGFLARCVADSLATSAGRIATRMDYLHQTQKRIRHLLQDGDALLPALEDGADLDEEIEAAGAIAAGVRREMNALADLARRLASSATLPNGALDRDMVDLNACVEEALRVTGAEERATVTRRLGPLPELFASRAEIRLLLTQVIENAVLAVQDSRKRAGAIKVDTTRRNGDILITVIDNGGGISAERRAKIFKPFYTSRDGAMGLGLTLASHLAEKYEGDVKVNSLPGQGTVTRITLPAGVPGE